MKGEQLKAAIIEASRQRRTRHEIEGVLPDGEALVFYVAPFSAADLAKHGQRLFDGDQAVFVDLLIDKAQHEDGERVFGDDAREWLPPCLTATTTAKIAEAIAGTELRETIENAAEDAAGNSEGIPFVVPSSKRASQ